MDWKAEWAGNQPEPVASRLERDRGTLRADFKDLGKTGIKAMSAPPKRLEIHDAVIAAGLAVMVAAVLVQARRRAPG